MINNLPSHNTLETTAQVRAVAFYLPQFHPIPENDQWWGKGFTEWTNVAKARPLFKGHYQPHIPADLGFYDLRLQQARIAQADLARLHGIEGFCYWHYWFNGKRLLERPFNEVLETGVPNFPFCLAWANETWSRRWLGEEKDVLIPQTYSERDDLNHIHWLIGAFKDKRYIRINNRPLFIIYRPKDLPDPIRTTSLFRSECVKEGLPDPFLIGSDGHCRNFDCRSIGFDATLLFLPQLGNLKEFLNDAPSSAKLLRNQEVGVHSDRLKIYDYAESIEIMLDNRNQYAHPVIPSIFVGWDNTPRRGENAIIITNTTVEAYQRVLTRLVQEQREYPADERLIFINAWNEWAEGNHLEPDLKNGKAFLEATRKAIISSKNVNGKGTHFQSKGSGLEQLSRTNLHSQLKQREKNSKLKSDQISVIKQAIAKLNQRGLTFHDQVSALSDQEWKALLQLSVGTPVIAGIDFPGLPPDDIQIRTVGSANKLGEAFVFFDFAKWGIKELDISINNESRLLDFGVGFGRIYRMFMKDFSQGNIIGCDVNQKYVDICRKTISNGIFHKNRIHPPLDYSDEYFNVITAYSVFSHLNMELALSWLNEFYRILRPGGMVLLTIRTFHFVISAFNIQDRINTNSPLAGYQRKLASLYTNLDNTYTRFNNGEFIYPENIENLKGSQDDDFFNGYYNSQYYSEAVVSLKWLIRNLEQFDLIFYSDMPEILPQALVLLRKRQNASKDRQMFGSNVMLYANTRSGIPALCQKALALKGGA